MEEFKKLKDEKINYLIQELYKELDIPEKEKNRLEVIHAKKINELYFIMKEVIKNISVLVKYKISYKIVYKKTDIDNILYEIEQIEQDIKNLKSPKNTDIDKKTDEDLLIFCQLLRTIINNLLQD